MCISDSWHNSTNPTKHSKRVVCSDCLLCIRNVHCLIDPTSHTAYVSRDPLLLPVSHAQKCMSWKLIARSAFRSLTKRRKKEGEETVMDQLCLGIWNRVKIFAWDILVFTDITHTHYKLQNFHKSKNWCKSVFSIPGFATVECNFHYSIRTLNATFIT